MTDWWSLRWPSEELQLCVGFISLCSGCRSVSPLILIFSFIFSVLLSLRLALTPLLPPFSILACYHGNALPPLLGQVVVQFLRPVLGSDHTNTVAQHSGTPAITLTIINTST